MDDHVPMYEQKEQDGGFPSPACKEATFWNQKNMSGHTANWDMYIIMYIYIYICIIYLGQTTIAHMALLQENISLQQACVLQKGFVHFHVCWRKGTCLPNKSANNVETKSVGVLTLRLPELAASTCWENNPGGTAFWPIRSELQALNTSPDSSGWGGSIPRGGI